MTRLKTPARSLPICPYRSRRHVAHFACLHSEKCVAKHLIQDRQKTRRYLTRARTRSASADVPRTVRWLLIRWTLWEVQSYNEAGVRFQHFVNWWMCFGDIRCGRNGTRHRVYIIYDREALSHCQSWTCRWMYPKMEPLKAACVDCLRLRRQKQRLKGVVLVWMLVGVLLLVRGIDGALKEGTCTASVTTCGIIFIYVKFLITSTRCVSTATRG